MEEENDPRALALAPKLVWFVHVSVGFACHSHLTHSYRVPVSYTCICCNTNSVADAGPRRVSHAACHGLAPDLRLNSPGLLGFP